MQGIVFDIKRFAVHDGPGIRTTVFLKGCNMNCLWCHNPESIRGETVCSVKKVKIDGKLYDHEETVGTMMSVNQVMEVLVRDAVFMEESGGGATFSGGEPTLQHDFLHGLLKACNEYSIPTAVDTNGLIKRDILQKLAPLTDLFLFDFKHYDAAKHKEGTGVSNEKVLENLEYLLQQKSRVRVRIPVIPGFNAEDNDIKEMAKTLKSMPGALEQVDLLPFHTLAQNKYKRFDMDNRMGNIQGLKKADLLHAKELFEKEGFRVKIGG
jgi:pyruvate formate lyase activating enzyme